MKGFRLHTWGADLQWEDIADRPPGPGEVALSVEACGVGLTVLNCIRGDLSDEPELLPRVPGHELVGRVTEAGEGVDEALIGSQVVAYFYLSCGHCSECAAGDDSLCRNLAGWVGVHTDGGYAPRTVLPAMNVIPIPDTLDPVAATVVPDAVATPVHVSRSRARIHAGDRVVVVGAGGGVGIHMVQVAALDGGDVVGLDIEEAKLARIAELGARAVRSDDFSALDAADLFADGRPTVVVDLLGSETSLNWSLDALDSGGRLVVLTTFRDKSLELDPRLMVFKEVSILGSRYASKSEVAVAAELVASGAIRPIIGEVAGPEEVLGVHARLEAGTLVGRGALDWRTHV